VSQRGRIRVALKNIVYGAFDKYALAALRRLVTAADIANGEISWDCLAALVSNRRGLGILLRFPECVSIANGVQRGNTLLASGDPVIERDLDVEDCR